MDNQNLPPEELYRQPGAIDHSKLGGWFTLHHKLAYTLFAMLFLAIVAGAYYFQSSRSVPDYEAPVHHAKTDPTADWKIYTNAQYGFEFRYPTSFSIKGNDKSGLTSFIDINYASNKNSFILTSPANLPNFQVNSQFVTNYEKLVGNGNVDPKADNINGKNMYLAGIGDQSIDCFIELDKSNTLGVTFMHIDTETIIQILSTFKFTK